MWKEEDMCKCGNREDTVEIKGGGVVEEEAPIVEEAGVLDEEEELI